MATRKCPFCAEKIQFEAKVCHFCKRDLPAVTQAKKKTSTGVKVLVVFFVLVGWGMVAENCGTVLDSPSAGPPPISRRLKRERINNSPNFLRNARAQLDAKQYMLALNAARLIPKEAAEYAGAQKIISVAEIGFRAEAPARERKRLWEAKEQQKKRELARFEVRKRIARLLEVEMLEKYIDMKITTRGRKRETLHLEWLGISRPYVHNFINDDNTMAGFRIAGFKKIIFTDGSEYERKTWTYTIQE